MSDYTLKKTPRDVWFLANESSFDELLNGPSKRFGGLIV